MGLIDFNIYYSMENKVVIAKIINKFAKINSPNYYDDITKKIRELLVKHNCYKLFTDYSLTGIELNYDLEYYLAKNINKIFDYPKGTYSAIYEGKFYSDKKWAFIRNIFNQDGVNNIEIFGDSNEAMDWLLSK